MVWIHVSAPNNKLSQKATKGFTGRISIISDKTFSVIKNESTATYFSIPQYTENMFCMHAPDEAMKTVQIIDDTP